MLEREIMHYQGSKKGPLLIVIGGIHGNESAGVEALQLVAKMLDVEPITNPTFEFCGKIIGIRGNIQACTQGVRYLKKDLNRSFLPEVIDYVMSSDPDILEAEDLELHQLLTYILEAKTDYPTDHLYILDLHTTSSPGGIFALPSQDQESVEMALALHAPVITNILTNISGTTLHYFVDGLYDDMAVTAVTFEAGQHNDTKAVNRSIAAIVNCLRSVGCVRSQDVANIHDERLRERSSQYPKLSKVIDHHAINVGDDFVMRPGYENFDPINIGDHLADDNHGPIYAKKDGLMLMPLYQKQGNDGYYIVEDISK